MINKNVFFYTLLVLIILPFYSCSDNEEDRSEPKEKPVVLIGEAFSFDSESGQTWNSSQKVGVFMVEAGTTNIIKNYSNREYLADNRSYNGYLVPANNEVMYLPEDGTKVDIIAYYPYKENEALTRAEGDIYHYTLDISDQSKTKADAFLYSQNAKELNKDNQKATVQLKPILSKMKMNFAPSTDMKEEDLKKVSAKLTNMSTIASFDLLNGAISFPSQSEDDKEIKLKRLGDGSQAEGIVFPGTVTENTQLELSIPISETGETKTLTWNLNEGITSLEGNIQYDMLVEVGANSIKATVTNKSPIYIQDWNNDETVDGNASVTIPNLVKNGDMENLIATDIKTGTSSPKETEVWYGVNNQVTGGIDLQTDALQGNVLHMNFSGSLNWFKNYIGYNATGAKTTNYRLSFKAKANPETPSLQVYIRVNKAGNYFFVKKGADLTKACAAEVIKPSNEWKTYSVDFNFTQLVNTLYSTNISISQASESDCNNFCIAFATQTADADFYIDDVSLTKIK